MLTFTPRNVTSFETLTLICCIAPRPSFSAPLGYTLANYVTAVVAWTTIVTVVSVWLGKANIKMHWLRSEIH
jgi:hypothetical protein